MNAKSGAIGPRRAKRRAASVQNPVQTHVQGPCKARARPVQALLADSMTFARFGQYRANELCKFCSVPIRALARLLHTEPYSFARSGVQSRAKHGTCTARLTPSKHLARLLGSKTCKHAALARNFARLSFPVHADPPSTLPYRILLSDGLASTAREIVI